MRNKISITAISSISSLGDSKNQIIANYRQDNHHITTKHFDTHAAFVSELSEASRAKIAKLKHGNTKYQSLDLSVLYAIYVSRIAIDHAGWDSEAAFGINIGSSRGATELFEQYHQDFLKNGHAETLSSPTTTLGNIASWVAHDVKTKGPELSHSITCATALHAVLNGCAWIQSGFTDKFLVGGSEAALTSFTIAQMKALKVYAKQNTSAAYPCQALNLSKPYNSMIIGEGAAVACLEKGVSDRTLAVIEGIGYATEILEHNVSISTNATCFQDAMSMAMNTINPNTVDVIVTHTPGTIKGDQAEINAVKKVFGDALPALTTNKWKLGHTFGASGMLSVEMAVFMMQTQIFFSVPYLENQRKPKKIGRVLVNAVGFGGNAVSILLSLK